MQRLIAAAVLAFPALALGATSNWKIDSDHSQAGFKVRHAMVSNVEGALGTISGAIQLDEKQPEKSTVDATIDVGSIYTGNPKRDGHLKSPDFFDVAKFPTATFKSTSVKKKGKGKLEVTGDLTMHGVTKSVTLAVAGPTPELKDPFGMTRRGLTATTKINREDFGLTWNKAIETGGFMVSKDVDVNLSIEAVSAPADAPAAPAAAK